jgi:hypothetical protein
MRKQTKEVVWILIGFIFLIFILDFFLLNREGFSMGEVGETKPQCEYQYLAPTPRNADGKVKEWSTSTIDAYLAKFYSVNPNENEKNKMDREKFRAANSVLNMSEEEGQYYIKNGKFPLNPYIINTLQNDEKVKEFLNHAERTSKKPFNAETLSKLYNVRMIYTVVIMPTEPTDTSTLTLARQIYSGQTVGPNCDGATTEGTASSFTDADKQKLREVCKNL